MIWIPLALLALATHAGQTLIGEYSPISRMRLVFAINLFSVIALFPVIWIFPLPVDPVFYAGTVGVALLVCWIDYVMFTSFRMNGAGVSTRILSLTVFLTFILWTALNPDLLQRYMQAPLRTAVLLGSMMGAIFFLYRMRHCALSLAALRDLWPVILGGAGIAVMAKYAMDASGPEGVWYYTFIQGIIVSLIYAAALCTGRDKHRPTGRETLALQLQHGCLAGLIITIHILTKNSAFRFVENPAYVLILLLLAPFLISLIYRLVGREDNSDLTSGYGILVSAIVFVWATKVLG